MLGNSRDQKPQMRETESDAEVTPVTGTHRQDLLHEIADMMTGSRALLLDHWRGAISRSDQLQPREDLEGARGDEEALDGFFDVVRQELITPESYASLKTYKSATEWTECRY